MSRCSSASLPAALRAKALRDNGLRFWHKICTSVAMGRCVEEVPSPSQALRGGVLGAPVCLGVRW